MLHLHLNGILLWLRIDLMAEKADVAVVCCQVVSDL